MKFVAKIRMIALPIICSGMVLPMTSCSSTGKIVFANYESYFSTDLISKYQSDVTFLYYQTDGDIRAKFRRSYDIAIPTTAEALRYIHDGWVTRIDWSAFGTIAQETYPDGYYGEDDAQPYLQCINADQELQSITSGYEAEYLLAGYDTGFSEFAEETINIDVLNDAYHITREIDKYAYDNGFFPEEYLEEVGDEYSILDFIIPYFFQDYLFIYKGEELENPFGEEEPWTWGAINEKVGKGDEHDPRFDGRRNNKILANDDMRTNFDIGKIIQWENEGMNPSTFSINPAPNEETINDFKGIYEEFLGAYKDTNQFLLNSDSGQLVGTFSDYVNTSNGMYAYNGDALLASIGNGQADNEEYWSNQWYDFAKNNSVEDAPMSIIVPEYNLVAIDTTVINKNSVKLNIDGTANLDDEKTRSIYEFVYSTMLDHTDYSSDVGVASDNGETGASPTIVGSDELWYDDPNQIWAWDDEEEMYVYDVMNNFDWVMYISPWAKIDQYIWGYQYGKVTTGGDLYEYEPIDCGADYFWETVSGMFTDYIEGFDPDEDDDLCEAWATMMGEAYKILIGNTYFDEEAKAINAIEVPLSDLQKSNMYESYIRVKNTL